ncbi:MAG: cytochrome P450 [Reyranella sp.]|uniref:cytochrome P450 n=1 Tax=Reyranella sp. TaxID=1929291 RepID=UPI001AC16DF3|nr:cytochrome P450 [Reyranella sp.]MBN9086085.1 cytochrome P450 [Reyranella sp.]
MTEHADVGDPRLYREDSWRPHFARLRAEDPVHRHPESPYGPYWSVTRHADILKVELDPATYSSASANGGIQLTDQPAGEELPNFIRMDPPRHTAQRRTVAPIVAPSNLANLTATIEQRTAALLDGLPRNQEFDWVDKVSTELTAMMLATLFDFPFSERRRLTHWSDVAIANVDAEDAVVKSNAERMAELRTMAATMAELWKERTAAPPKFDLISMMAHSDATRDMPLNEFIGNFALLIVGGNDTTRNSMTGALLAFAAYPAERARLEASEALLPSAVCEMIRWQTPVIHMRRTATRDTELAGKTIRKGDKVVMWYVSGNRDESVMEDPEAFRIDRPRVRQHLSFGAGIHRCVGDRLAELQLQILWREILKRNLRPEILGEPVRLYSNFIRGIRSLPVILRA